MRKTRTILTLETSLVFSSFYLQQQTVHLSIAERRAVFEIISTQSVHSFREETDLLDMTLTLDPLCVSVPEHPYSNVPFYLIGMLD